MEFDGHGPEPLGALQHGRGAVDAEPLVMVQGQGGRVNQVAVLLLRKGGDDAFNQINDIVGVQAGGMDETVRLLFVPRVAYAGQEVHLGLALNQDG